MVILLGIFPNTYFTNLTSQNNSILMLLIYVQESPEGIEPDSSDSKVAFECRIVRFNIIKEIVELFWHEMVTGCYEVPN